MYQSTYKMPRTAGFLVALSDTGLRVVSCRERNESKGREGEMRGGKGPGDPKAGAPGPSPGGTPLGLHKASKDLLPTRLEVLVRGLLAHECPQPSCPRHCTPAHLLSSLSHCSSARLTSQGLKSPTSEGLGNLHLPGWSLEDRRLPSQPVWPRRGGGVTAKCG